MTLTIDLSAEKEAALRAAAALWGLPPDDYARRLVESGLPIMPQGGLLSPGEAEDLLDELAAETPDTPVLSADANTRAYYYQDHD